MNLKLFPSTSLEKLMFQLPRPKKGLQLSGVDPIVLNAASIAPEKLDGHLESQVLDRIFRQLRRCPGALHFLDFSRVEDISEIFKVPV